MKHRLLALSLLLLTATSLVAQGPPHGGGGGGSRAGFRMPDPILFSGPMVPEDFIDLVALDSTQYTSYRVQYTNFMAQTRPQRDSLVEFRRQMRERFESGEGSGGMNGGRQGGYGGRGAGGEGRDKMQKMLGALEKQQKIFDDELKALLQESQYKRYETWRKDEFNKAERDMRERYGGGPR